MTCCCGSPLHHHQWRRWKACHMESDSLSPVSWSTLTPRTVLASSVLLVRRVRWQKSHPMTLHSQALLIIVEMFNVKSCLNLIDMLMRHAFRWDQWVRRGDYALLLSCLWPWPPVSQEEKAQSPEQDLPEPVFCHCQCQSWPGGSTS